MNRNAAGLSEFIGGNGMAPYPPDEFMRGKHPDRDGKKVNAGLGVRYVRVRPRILVRT